MGLVVLRAKKPADDAVGDTDYYCGYNSGHDEEHREEE